MTENARYRQQIVSYLGFLEAKLRDLRGATTLTYELIQNADDVKDERGAPGTRRILFDVRDDALIVTNDGAFRPEDFARLQHIAGGGKREEAGVTGAFGLGFIAVYQVTDAPEIISSGRHWTIRPDEPEDRRILERDVGPTQGTQFRLPWAFDESSVRQQLRLESVRPEQLDDLAIEMGQAAAQAALFLKQLQALEVRRNGVPVRQIEREVAGDVIHLRDNGTQVAWRLFHGDFTSEAADLRATYPQIEAGRHDRIELALPQSPLRHGRLFAGLPTEAITPLPFHLNAAFFPSTDRRRVLFGDDYQSAWNRAIVHGAARALADHVEALPALLGHDGLWQALHQLHLCHEQAGQPDLDAVFSSFWREVTPQLRTAALILSADGRWLPSPQARLPAGGVETAAVPILERLGLPIVHPDLSPYFDLMRLPEIAVPELSLADVVAALSGLELADRTAVAGAPPPLQTVPGWQRLWDLLDVLFVRATAADKEKALLVLPILAIVPTVDGLLRRPSLVARGDETTRTLFWDVAWLHEGLFAGGLLKRLVAEFDLRRAIEYLAGFSQEELETAWRDGRLDLPALFRWFESRQEELLYRPALRQQLRRLPLGPAYGDLYPLADLSLPGGFSDPLQLAQVIDVEAVGERSLFFLQDLGMQPLTFASYVREQMPRLLEQHQDLPSDARHRLAQLLAERLGELRDDQLLQDRLQHLPLVACLDGHFRPAATAYASREVMAVLGERVYVAEPVESRSIAALHQWLGVAGAPRPADVLRRLETVTGQKVDAASRQAVAAVFAYLAENCSYWDEVTRLAYEPLRRLAWLPAEGSDTWYTPGQVYAVFQRPLFASQAHFLDLPPPLQTAAAGADGLLRFLGVPVEPEIGQVVAHLLACSRRGEPVDEAVYEFLNEHVTDPALEKLSGESIWLLPGGRYARAAELFWGDHPFGRRRHRLDPAARRYHQLLDRLGVRESPAAGDYIEVLLEISQMSQADRPLDEATAAVVARCWQGLATALAAGELGQKALEPLRRRPVVPNARGVLTRPGDLFVLDHAGLAARFPRLADRFLPPSPKSWPALAAVGLRPLSQAAQVEFVAPPNPVPDKALQERLQSRCALLEQVIRAERMAAGEPMETAVLDQMRLWRAEQLRLRYRLPGAEQEWTDVETVPAVWIAAENALYFTIPGDAVPWTAIARELAQAIRQTPAIGGLAIAIREVLASDTAAEAAQTLDDLGYRSSSGSLT